MQSHLFIVSLRCWAFWVLFRKSFPIPIIPVYLFPIASWSCSKFQAFISRSLIHFELILVQVKDRDLVSVFYMWISNFLSSICWRGYFFFIVFWAPLSKIYWLLMCGFMSGSSILIHWSSCLFLCQYHVVFIVWLCSIVWSQVLCCLQLCSELLWLFEP
jgi:hypothetical protein